MPQSFRSPAKIARRLRLAPLASRAIENWPSFMYHYALGLTPASPYRFRSGQRLRIGRGTDHVPIIEIFLRKDYGEIPDGSVIVDLGANIGTFSVYAATSASRVRVYAYEPMPDFFRLMRANVSLNGLDASVTCFEMAVAADRADRELVVAAAGLHFPTLVLPPQTTPTASRRVHCTDLLKILDTNRLPRVDIVKMDVEGSEYDILYGMPSDAFHRIRELRMEYHNLDHERCNVAHLKRFLGAQGYDVTRETATTPDNGTLWAEQHD
jgi:FkbM family methyltransferase